MAPYEFGINSGYPLSLGTNFQGQQPLEGNNSWKNFLQFTIRYDLIYYGALIIILSQELANDSIDSMLGYIHLL